MIYHRCRFCLLSLNVPPLHRRGPFNTVSRLPSPLKLIRQRVRVAVRRPRHSLLCAAHASAPIASCIGFPATVTVAIVASAPPWVASRLPPSKLSGIISAQGRRSLYGVSASAADDALAVEWHACRVLLDVDGVLSPLRPHVLPNAFWLREVLGRRPVFIPRPLPVGTVPATSGRHQGRLLPAPRIFGGTRAKAFSCSRARQLRQPAAWAFPATRRRSFLHPPILLCPFPSPAFSFLFGCLSVCPYVRLF